MTRAFLSTLPASARERALALGVVAVSVAVFLALVPFAQRPLGQVWAFIPVYQTALVVGDLITAWLLYTQFWYLRTRALLVLASAYVLTALLAVAHALSFPGLFAPGGLLGAGPQTTAWLYMFWHAGFPLLVIAYAVLARGTAPVLAPQRRPRAIGLALAGAAGAAAALTLLATAGKDALPPIMAGNRYTPLMLGVVTSVWVLSMAALALLWRRKPHTVLDLWLMVVMCAWIFDVALAAVFNAGRFDLGFYAGRIYGLLAATFVLLVFLGESARLYAEVEGALQRRNERLEILHQIDRSMAAEEPLEAAAAGVIRPLREVLDVPRVIVNRFDLERGEVEWVAAAGRKQVHVGPGVRYSIALMGDPEALKRGEPQRIDTRALPRGPDTDALLASGVNSYMVVPMVAGGELLGAISFGNETGVFPDEKVAIAREVATQLAIALKQARLLARVRDHASELEARVAERTAQLDVAARELKDLYERAPCGYHSVNADGLIVRMNDTWLSWLGYARDEVVGRMKHADLMTPESARRFWAETFPRFRREGFLEAVEFEYRRRDGSTFVGQLNATSIYDRDGRYLMSRSTVFDVTARKLAEERLAAVNRELESFSYSVSHDLRAPLRAIDGYARMLEGESAAVLSEEGRRLLGVVRASARRMGRLIDDLLEFSRLGKLDLAKSHVDMAGLAREVADEVAREHPAASIEIGALPAAHADRTLLRQVWANLLGNAAKYSAPRERPRIEVSGRAEGDQCVYAVRDNGVGFDMRYAAKLFAVFQRLHRQDEFPGTGVGLAIVQRIVSRHGGRVWAEAELERGSCFSFSLPRAATEGPTPV